MAHSRSSRREPCAFEGCGSRRFHLGNDGYTYCDQGHQQSERGTVVAEDTGELVQQGPRSRKKSSDAESTTSKAHGFHGARAFEHYLLCVQLVLRKQLCWLIEVQKLPGELETLVRDLWALRLQRLRSRTSHESDAESEPASSQVFSSQTESETATGSRSQSSRRSRRKDIESRDETPNLAQNLGLCYIGTLLLRLPLTIADLHRWINEGELLYYRASRELPPGMKARLPGVYQELLEPQDLLKPQRMHEIVGQMLKMLRVEFGMAIPPVNTPLLLYKWIQDLALPVEVFTASQRLARMLSIGNTFDTEDSNIVLRYPEVRLMAVVVISTKLLLPCDKVERHAQSLSEMSGLSMDWDEWVEAESGAEKETEGQSQLKFEEAFKFTESDCIEATDETLDAYLDWYNDNIATEEVRERGQAGRDADFRRALFRMFPVSSEDSSKVLRHSDMREKGIESQIRQVQSSLRPRKVGPIYNAIDIARPGSFYPRFRSVEDLSGPMKVFFEKAATLAAVPLDDIVHSVFLLERRLERHEETLRKRTKAMPIP